MEAVLATALFNMLNAEEVVVRTAVGPGGRAGPLRIDMNLGRAALQVCTPAGVGEAWRVLLYDNRSAEGVYAW